MTGSVMLDTHAWVWTFVGQEGLSPAAAEAVEEADEVCLSSITLFEIAQKVRLGKWNDLTPFAAGLEQIAVDQGVRVLALDGALCRTAGALDWPHRDPFDRLIAATALSFGLPLVSRDRSFRALDRLTCIW